ncbi:hypothetical protein R6Q59_029456 [Mikania micrantha]
MVGKTLMVFQSKWPGRIKASNVVSNGEISLDNNDKDEEDTIGQQSRPAEQAESGEKENKSSHQDDTLLHSDN